MNEDQKERLRNAELLAEHWQGRYYAQEGMTEKYKELMDATAKDADRAYELLRRAETEMRYAGWNRLLTDNYGRKDIYDDIKEFLK